MTRDRAYLPQIGDATKLIERRLGTARFRAVLE